MGLLSIIGNKIYKPIFFTKFVKFTHFATQICLEIHLIITMLWGPRMEHFSHKLRTPFSFYFITSMAFFLQT